MTITTLFKRLEEKGYDNKHAQYYFLGAENPKVREDGGHGQEWYEDKLRKELEVDRRRVFQCWYGEEPTTADFGVGTIPTPKPAWHFPFSYAEQEYKRGDIDFAVDYILAHP